MKYVLFMPILLCQSLLTFSQAKGEKAVAAAVEKLRVAMIDANGSQLSELMSDDISYGHSSGLIEGKTSTIQKIVSGQSDFVSINLSEQVIQMHGNTAIVRHRLRAETNDNNKPGKADIKVILVWQKQGGAWKLLARQAVKSL